MNKISLRLRICDWTELLFELKDPDYYEYAYFLKTNKANGQERVFNLGLIQSLTFLPAIGPGPGIISGAPNENMVQNHLNIALLNIF